MIYGILRNKVRHSALRLCQECIDRTILKYFATQSFFYYIFCLISLFPHVYLENPRVASVNWKYLF